MRFKRRKGSQITRAKKQVYDGIQFASGLEVYAYRALKKAKIPFEYEGKTFELTEKFKFGGTLMDRGKVKGKSTFKVKPANIRNISYTPDFINMKMGFIIETKGFRTPEFKMRFKLFLKYLNDNNLDLDVYVPSNQKEVDITVDTILNRGSFKEKKHD